MSANFLNRARPGRVAREEGPDKRVPAPAVISRACCCPAWPAVRAVMPATARRPHPTDLLLCGHHYRVSRRALEDAGARVFVLSGCPGDALLDDTEPRPSAVAGATEPDGHVRP